MDPAALRARPRQRARRRIARLAGMLALVVGLLGVSAPLASAALVTDATYTVETVASGCGILGQTDDTGIFYSGCGKVIARWDKNGTRLADIKLPTGISNPMDVAPSPDGRYLYVTQDTKTPRRLNRGANATTYTLDANWKLKDLVVWNVPFTPIGRSIATDGRGDIYLSNGSFTTESQRSVAKFKPNGDFITAFGDWGKEPGNWITNQDLAVSRDGRRVFVGENCGTNCIYGTKGYDASRVTRYDFTPGGTYRFSRIVSTTGAYNGKAFPSCEDPGSVHSGYSLTLDYWENLYVTSTTCGRIQMFDIDPDPAKDRFVRSIARWDEQTTRNHYIASDWAGRLRAYQWNRVFTPKTIRNPAVPLPPLEPLPEPDIKAPVVANVTVPAVTFAQEIEIAVQATDDMGVAEMQLAREDGEWGPWQPFATPVAYELSDGYGIKGVYVRVRDMAGNESAAVYRTLSFQEPVAGGGNEPPPPGDAADPILSALNIPALTATREIQVTVEATDDTRLAAVRFANEDGNWAEWRPFAATSTWTLSAGQGAKAVFAQVRDAAGKESGVLLARTQFAADAPPPPPPGGEPDVTAPVLVSVDVPAETTTQEVEVRIEATDAVGVAQVRFANEDGNWTAWQAWAPTKRWTLSANYGAKLVYAQVRDAAGNESLVLSDRTSYVRTVAGPVDASDPALTAVEIPETTQLREVRVRLTATDDVGVTQVRFANEDGNWQAWKAFAREVPHQLTAGTGLKAVYAQVRDAAGRESNVLFVRTQVIP